MARTNGVSSALFVNGKHVGAYVPPQSISDGTLTGRRVARSQGDEEPRVAIEVGRRTVKIHNFDPVILLGEHSSTHVKRLRLGRKPSLFSELQEPYEIDIAKVQNDKKAMRAIDKGWPVKGLKTGGYPAVTDDLDKSVLADALRKIGSAIYEPFSKREQSLLHKKLSEIGIEIPLPGREITPATPAVTIPTR